MSIFLQIAAHSLPRVGWNEDTNTNSLERDDVPNVCNGWLVVKLKVCNRKTMIPWEWLVACKLQKIKWKWQIRKRSGKKEQKWKCRLPLAVYLQFTCDNILRQSLPLAATYHCECITFPGGGVHVISKDWSTHEGNPRPTSITWVWSYISTCLLKHIRIWANGWLWRLMLPLHRTSIVWVKMLPQMPSTRHQTSEKIQWIYNRYRYFLCSTYPIHFATVNVWHFNTSVKLCIFCWIAILMWS